MPDEKLKVNRPLVSTPHDNMDRTSILNSFSGYSLFMQGKGRKTQFNNKHTVSIKEAKKPIISD